MASDETPYRQSRRLRIRRGMLARTGREAPGDLERREPDELFDDLDAPQQLIHHRDTENTETKK